MRNRRRRRAEDPTGSGERPQRRRQGRERQAKKPPTFLKERGLHRLRSLGPLTWEEEQKEHTLQTRKKKEKRITQKTIKDCRIINIVHIFG
ncbi:hypothetical protein NDU88_003074 [Pleurodeles waltl]|uniref:Uncharacterized protein n=1 Tax=Pleurodeles waltl TaxID=8319 RepID=A0AAV7SCF4_PLEWA|nr:hypothetical protein NDU88_003074 [Pleurodeles waltl]